MRSARVLAILLSCLACSINKKGNSSSNNVDPSVDGNNVDPGTIGTVTGEIGSNGNNKFPTGPSLSPDSSYIRYVGRIEPGAPGGVRLAWPGTGFKVRVSNAKTVTVSAMPNQYGENNVVGAYVDGTLTQTFPLQTADPTQPTAQLTIRLPSTEEHVVSLIKRTEAGNGMVLIFNLATDGQFEEINDGERSIEIIGENAAAGYSAASTTGDTNCNQPINSVANPNQQDAAATFGALTAKAFNARASILAFSGRGLVQNSDGSTGVSLADTYPRLNPMDYTSGITKGINSGAVILNLGTNDINYWMKNTKGVAPDKAGYTAAMAALIKNVRQLNPDAAIVVTIGPSLSDYQCIGGNPNSGYSCASASGGTPILSLLREVTKAGIAQAGDSKTSFVEFPADTTNVGACYLPSAQGHAIMANLLIPAVAKATGWAVGSGAPEQPSLAEASKAAAPKVLTGTFTERPDVLKVGAQDPCSGINNKEFPQCHYCSPQPVDGNAVGTAQCPQLIGTQLPCHSYCHVPDGFAELHSSNPPTSGNHYPTPELVTFSNTPIPRGKWIHSMEHGSIVLTYNCPNGCSDALTRMKTLYDKYLVNDQSTAKAWVLVTPDPLLPAGRFSATAWTWSYQFDTFDDAATQAVDCFIQQHAFYGRECLNDGSTGNPRACSSLVDKPMFTTGG